MLFAPGITKLPLRSGAYQSTDYVRKLPVSIADRRSSTLCIVNLGVATADHTLCACSKLHELHERIFGPENTSETGKILASVKYMQVWLVFHSEWH